jgi:YegS/Rv2252/BmrU family lipid kinase
LFDLEVFMSDQEKGYVCLIVNPNSGLREEKRLVNKFKSYLYDQGIDERTFLTESLEHACELATDASADDNCRLVVAAGGDGTVREVAHGLAGSDKAMIVVPGGTENLLANELGMGRSVKSIINAFEKGEVVELDLGRINGRLFTCVAGFGWDGDVIKKVSSRRKGNMSHLNYFWPIWETFWEHKFPVIRVEADGEEVFNDKGLVFVGNISRYAIGLGVCRDAKFDDGLLDICAMRCASKWKLVKLSLMVIFKKHPESKDVVYRKAGRVAVSSEAEVNSEIDGDPGPGLPIGIDLMPKAVKVLVPAGSHPTGLRRRIWRLFGTG